MGGKAFKSRLAYSVASIIMAENNFVTLLKCFITNVLKYKAHLKTSIDVLPFKNQVLHEFCTLVSKLKHC